jgi:hypothetical protein
MDRQCKGCGLTQDVTLFAAAGNKNGVLYYRHKCVQCYSKQKGKERRSWRVQFTENKKLLKCEHCNNSDYRVLEFHHLNPDEKEYDIGRMVTKKFSVQRIENEMKKCIVLCANCHKIEHYRLRELKRTAQALMVELVDTGDSKSPA